MTNRSRTEIVNQILEAASGYGDDDAEGMVQTQMMYKVFLTSTQLKEYLILLIENGLLHYDSAMRTYKTTEKGLAFLQAYSQMDQILREQRI
jgi:predicted transcriptional regulator